ncbi:transporter [Sphingomonas mollis]|uniref:Transporter n=1 Tax=Sphingomonas mollis TaxID=2795726 RepID=A0ABS0XP68_9SPHN|nr:transporter [Sphingomonas sp. BT553]MBJ6121518.1 transporter [Sphingomonas sp. BT553]
MKTAAAAWLVLAMLPGAAMAQNRDLCAHRPGLGTPACTVDPGHVLIETGVADWTRDDSGDGRIDTIQIGSTLARFGVDDATELELGWTPYGHQRERSAMGDVTHMGRVGDVTVGVKRSIANPDGHGLSLAVLPFATLPVGRTPIGAGDWGAGLTAPLTYDLSDAVQLEFTPEVDAAVDEDGHGRHLAYSAVVGAEWDVAETVELIGEVQAIRDRDPGGRATMYLAGLSAAWQPGKRWQFDIGTAAGLNHDAPAVRVYGGIAALF